MSVLGRWWHRVFSFNQYERDAWIAQQARLVPPGSRVLDVGAGSCPYRALFAHCDYKTQDFAQLKPDQLIGKKGYGILDYVSDILFIPVKNQSYDFIVCTEVLEHTPRPDKALQEFARILRQNGKLILTAPLGAGLHQEPHHYYGGFTPHWYYKFLTEAGFNKITVESNGGFFKFYAQESIRFSILADPRRVNSWKRFLFFPIWFLTLPFLRLIVPLICFVLDGSDTARKFTVGYHVTAERR